MLNQLTSWITEVPAWAWVASNLLTAGVAFFVRQHYVARLELLRAELKKEGDLALERARKEHELEIDRKKKQYDSKRLQFERYWLMLDDYSRKQRQGGFLTEMWAVFNACMLEFLTAGDDHERMNAAYNRMMSSLQGATQMGLEEFQAIRHETQSLRLVAGENLFGLLTKLDQRLDEERTMSMDSISKLSNLQAYISDSSLQESAVAGQQALQEHGEVTAELYKEVMQEMRRELNET